MFLYLNILWITAQAQRQAQPAKGQGLVEYALIVGLVAVSAIVVLGLLSGKIGQAFGAINDALPAATATP